MKPTVTSRALSGLVAEMLSPEGDDVPLSEWAERHRIVPAGTSELPGPWKNDAFPYLKGIMDACSDPEIRQVTVMKGSQQGVTEVIINYLLRCAAGVDSGPAMLLYPSGRLGSDLVTERVIPSIEKCPAVVKRLRKVSKETGQASSRNLKAQKLEFRGMTVYAVGSNSQSELEMRSVKHLLVDELDAAEFGEDALALAFERQKAFTRYKRIIVSKPGDRGKGIDGQYAKGDRRRFYVPCPHEGCGHWQTLKWQRVRWEGPGATEAERVERRREADPDAVEKTAWYSCEKCKGRIDNWQKAGMLARGVWLREGERVEVAQWLSDEVTKTDEYGSHSATPPLRHSATSVPRITGRPVKRGDHASFAISSLYSPKLPWGYVVAQWLRNSCVATRAWVTGDLGEPWSPDGEKAEMAELKRVCDGSDYRLAAHAGREGRVVPAWVLALVGYIDLQRDRAYLSVWGFGDGGRDSALIWYGVRECPMEDAGALDRLSGIVSGRDLNLVHADGLPMRVDRWGVDSGDGMYTLDVYAWTRQFSHVFAGKGMAPGWGGSSGKLFEKNLQPFERAARGGRPPTAGEARLLLINTDHWKNMVLVKLRRAIAGVGREASGVSQEPASGSSSRLTPHAPRPSGEHAVRLAAEADVAAALEEAGVGGIGGGVGGMGSGLIWLPKDCDTEFLLQLTAEQRESVTIKTGAKTGQRRSEWRLRPGRTDNHFFDCAVGAHCLAYAEGAGALRREAIEKARRMRRMAGGEPVEGVGAARRPGPVPRAGGGGGGGGGEDAMSF